MILSGDSFSLDIFNLLTNLWKEHLFLKQKQTKKKEMYLYYLYCLLLYYIIINIYIDYKNV